MERRNFLKTASMGAAALLISGSSLMMTACSINAKALLNTVISAIQSILKVAEPTASWAAQLQSSLTALQQAEAQWTAGGTVTIVIDALNTVEAVCAVIPFTAVYSPLIDVLVSGIEAVLAVLVPQPAAAKLLAKFQVNPHHGRVPLRKRSWWHETEQGAFKAQWNDMVGQLGLSQAKI